MPATSRPRQFRFDRASLDPDERQLVIDGKVAPITARAFDLLVLLVERGGQLVHKDEIFERVWPGVIVEENNLQVQVSTLRKIIGSAAIENVPGRGYRFVPKVEACEVDEPAQVARSHVPRPLTTFVGQAGQLDQCARLLHKSRLLTVTGIGGLGKTRLSLEMANACSGDYLDGVWFVDLAPITDPGLVSQAVALVLGVADQAAERMLEAIQRFIRNRRALLILDSCEHQLRTCAEVVGGLLRACTHLTVLATSREPLHLQGEAIFTLPTLSFPDADRELTLDAIAGYDAVRLFVERAAAVRPGFELTADNERFVRAICARVDGIPLALELAAARVRVLSVEMIAERLSHRFRLLKSDDTTAPSRHQTLRATIDWSYELLSGPERQLLERLAVFAGGWPFAAAEAVGGGDGIDPDEVLDLHSHLVDKSLVAVELNGARYRLLDTVREYALARLEQSGGATGARTRHLDFYARFAEAAEPHLMGPLENAWSERCNLERQNLIAAYGFGLSEHPDARPALRLVYGLRRWIARGAFDVGQPALADLLALPGAQGGSLHRCHGLVAAAFLSYFKGAYRDAVRYASEALAIARELEGPALAADALRVLGLGYMGTSDYSAARASIDDAVAVARATGARHVLLDALNCRAELYAIEGDLDRAESLYEESLRLANEVQSAEAQSVALLNLARDAVAGGSAERAAAFMRTAAEIGGGTGTARYAQQFFNWSAAVAAITGDDAIAAQFYGASNSRYLEKSQQREPADERMLAPIIDRARAALGAATFARYEAKGAAMRSEQATAELLKWLGTTAKER